MKRSLIALSLAAATAFAADHYDNNQRRAVQEEVRIAQVQQAGRQEAKNKAAQRMERISSYRVPQSAYNTLPTEWSKDVRVFFSDMKKHEQDGGDMTAVPDVAGFLKLQEARQDYSAVISGADGRDWRRFERTLDVLVRRKWIENDELAETVANKLSGSYGGLRACAQDNFDSNARSEGCRNLMPSVKYRFERFNEARVEAGAEPFQWSHY